MQNEHLLPITYFGTTTLGHLLDALADIEASKPVEFDFCGLVPDICNGGAGVRSYRGFYEHLAIAWRLPDFASPVTVYGLRKRLAAVVGNTLQGYKGGSYRMDRNTPIWVDNAGDATSTAIVGINDESSTIVLQTKQVTH